MHDIKNKYTFRKHKAYGLVGAMFATTLMVAPGALNHVPVLGGVGDSTVKADTLTENSSNSSVSNNTVVINPVNTNNSESTSSQPAVSEKESSTNRSGSGLEEIRPNAVTEKDKPDVGKEDSSTTSVLEGVKPKITAGEEVSSQPLSVTDETVQPKRSEVAQPSEKETVPKTELTNKAELTSATVSPAENPKPTPSHGSYFRSAGNTSSSTNNRIATEEYKPQGDVIARGEDGVPWELYENGYLLFKPEAGKDTLSATSRNGVSSNDKLSTSPSWKEKYHSKIKYVGFKDKVYAPSDSSYLFSRSNETYSYIDVLTEISDFNPTFIDTSKIDTSKVTNMRGMFKGLTKIEHLDVGSWDTSKVTNMSELFTGVTSVSSLNVDNWNTSNVTTMANLFAGMTRLTSLNIGSWNLTKVNSTPESNSDSIFSGLYKLGELTLSATLPKKPERVTYNSTYSEVVSIAKMGINTLPDKLSYNAPTSNKWYKVDQPNNILTVNEWAKAYESDPVANAGTWVRLGANRVVNKVTYKALLDDPEEAGTHRDLGNNVTGVSIKPKVEETAIPFETRYEPNPQADYGVRSDKVAGKNGKTIKTTTYTLNQETGVVTPNPPTTTTEPAVTHVVSVGTKPTTEVTYEEPTKTYVRDDEREFGQPNKPEGGTRTEISTPVTYSVNPTTGEVTSTKGTPSRKEGLPTTIKVATKDKVEPVEKDGVHLNKITNYNLDPNTGIAT